MWMILSRGRKPKRECLLEVLAEEDTQILALAYAHAKYLTMYGVDIEKTVYTATENAEIMSKAYQKGYYDAMDRMSRAEEKAYQKGYSDATGKANTALETIGSLDKIANELEDLKND